MKSDRRDVAPFLAVGVGLVLTVGILLTIDRSEPDVMTGIRLFIGFVGAVVTVQSLRTALRWTRPVARRPAPSSPHAPARRNSDADDKTFGAGSVGSDMAASSTFIVGGPGTGMADLAGTAQTDMLSGTGGGFGEGDFSGGDAGGGEAGGSDSGGGGDSGGSIS